MAKTLAEGERCFLTVVGHDIRVLSVDGNSNNNNNSSGDDNNSKDNYNNSF